MAVTGSDVTIPGRLTGAGACAQAMTSFNVDMSKRQLQCLHVLFMFVLQHG